jgi:multicomponent Na+:H+ antiporter subunit D
MDDGTRLIDAAASQAHRDWAALACLPATALTGGAVLRATGRIFLGWGRVPGEEERSPSEQEQEDANRPLWLLLLPAAILLFLALAQSGALQRYARVAVVALMSPGRRHWRQFQRPSHNIRSCLGDR